jgi:hypothetical protein
MSSRTIINYALSASHSYHSYNIPNSNITVNIDTITPSIARIHFTYNDNKPILLSEEPTIILVNDEDKREIKSFLNSFFIAYFTSYTLYWQSNPVMHIQSSRQQEIILV